MRVSAFTNYSIMRVVFAASSMLASFAFGAGTHRGCPRVLTLNRVAWSSSCNLITVHWVTHRSIGWLGVTLKKISDAKHNSIALFPRPEFSCTVLFRMSQTSQVDMTILAQQIPERVAKQWV